MSQPDQYDMTLVGYARVSTEEQSLDMQIDALRRAGVHPDRIFVEKVSGVSQKRPGRELALKATREGDTFVVWKLDRLGRSVRDLLRFIERLDARGVEFKSLQDAIDTRTPIGQFVLVLLAAVAQFERDLIAARTRAGVKRAQERGVRFGQPPKVTPEVEAQMSEMFKAGASVRDVAKAFGVTPTTVYTYFDSYRLGQLRPKQE